MTIRTRAEMIKVALAQHANIPGTCQANVVKWFNAPAVGDVNHDGDADAVDGWESEPKQYRCPGDRNPPFGVPLSFGGGFDGYGHRAATLLHQGRIRSTDMDGNTWKVGVTGTVSAATTSEAIAIIEHQMGVHYLGWSKTISGNLLDGFHQGSLPAPRPQTRGARVDRTLRNLRRALAHSKSPARRAAIRAAIAALLKIKTHDRKVQS